jgi:hypothetical protein
MPMPDAQIHPTATGKAKDIVDSHQDKQDLIFYSGMLVIQKLTLIHFIGL